jgi:hypothetical protein
MRGTTVVKSRNRRQEADLGCLVLSREGSRNDRSADVRVCVFLLEMKVGPPRCGAMNSQTRTSALLTDQRRRRATR